MGKHPLPKETKDKIISLRRQGYSIPELHRLLGTSKSTLSRYVKNVEILPEYKQRWLDRRNASRIISERRWEVAYRLAKDSLDKLSDRELILIGSALYWAEGAKGDFNFTNSDPEMIRVYIHILRKVFDVKLDDIKVSIRLFEDLKIKEAVEFWSGIVGKNLQSNVSINILAGKKQGKLKFGMCRIRVRKSGLLLKRIFAINKRVISLISSS